MSLRDLSTTALCAPTEPSSSGAGPSSANPLAQLVESVLPTNARPEHSGTSSTRRPRGPALSASASGYSDAALAIVSGAHLSDGGPQLSAPPEGAPSGTDMGIHSVRLPTGLFPNQTPNNMPVPVLGPPTPIPAPMAGGATDVFERAFQEHLPRPAIATPSSSVTLPSPSNAPALKTPAPFAAPVAPMYRPHGLGLRPSWREFNSAFSTMSINASQLQQTPLYTTALPHSQSLHHPRPPLPAHAMAPGPQVAASSAKQHTAVADPSTAEQAAAEASSSSAVQDEKHDHIQSDTISRALSWSEEFASLEAMEGPRFDFASDGIEDLLYEETLQTAFQHWLRADSTDAYKFANTLNEGSVSTRSAVESLQEGVRAHTDGRLSAAVYHLEEALQRQEANKDALPKAKEALAWYVLGLSLADLDDDERAIQALTQGLGVYNGTQTGHRREDNPYLWQSLIGLAVSYTNELEHAKALRMIREWIDLRNATESGDGETGTVNLGGNGVSNDLFRRSNHEDVLTALNLAATQTPQDADVFTVLGILHNLNREYDHAATAFRQAAAIRPDTPGVWNKLGATLANGGNTSDALRAYRKAVDLQPALVRAWVNVGTAYSNRQEFDKAVRYYLKAIGVSKETAAEVEKLQAKPLDRSGHEGMQHVWGYIRSSLISLSRGDLLNLVERRDEDALRSHFNF